jgi:hypothetical protein
MIPPRPILIVADSYQFLDTVCGTTPATLQEWRVADNLERLETYLTQSPLAVVVDLEARRFDPIAALELLHAQAVSAPLVMLSGPDTSRLSAAKHWADSHALNVTGTLRRPLIMTALLRLLKHRETEAHVNHESPAVSSSALLNIKTSDPKKLPNKNRSNTTLSQLTSV